MSGPRRLTTFAWRASAALVAALVVALLVPAGAPAQTRTVETATNGTVTAELSYVKRRRGRSGFRFLEYRDFRVKITRAGVGAVRPARRRALRPVLHAPPSPRSPGSTSAFAT